MFPFADQVIIMCILSSYSDDRSVEAFRNKLESATQMKSVIEADPRPNCLIIDEIDGAPAVSLSAYLSVCPSSIHTCT